MSSWLLGQNLKIKARDGTEVWINRNTWLLHICDGHPEMKTCIGEVIEALKDPEAIYLGVNETRFAFRYSEKKGKFIMALYHKGSTQGRLKTAYQTSNPYVVVEEMIKVYP